MYVSMYVWRERKVCDGEWLNSFHENGNEDREDPSHPNLFCGVFQIIV